MLATPLEEEAKDLVDVVDNQDSTGHCSYFDVPALMTNRSKEGFVGTFIDFVVSPHIPLVYLVGNDDWYYPQIH